MINHIFTILLHTIILNMRKINILLTALSFALMFVCFNAFPQESSTYKGMKVASKKVRFKLNANTSAETKAMIASRMNTKGFMQKASDETYMQTGLRSLDNLNAQFGTIDMKRVFRPGGKFEQKHIEAGLDLWYEATVSDDQLEQVLSAFQGLAEIDIAEPVYQMTLRDVEGSGDLPYVGTAGMEEDSISGPPNDPSYSVMYGLDIIDAEAAWSIETGSKNVVVAIEDQGVDYNHEDLAGHMWTNTGEVPDNGIDDDGNGFVDDYYGYNFGNNNGDIAIDYHGTHVGGTVAAETNNGVGVAGIAGGSGNNDGVRLMSLSVFGYGSQGGFAEAFVYAADMGAVISQNSWGGGSQSDALEDAIDYFIENAGGPNEAMDGGLVVFAAGNDYSSNPNLGYPASYYPTVAVASITSTRAKSSFSNYGTWVDISAPGSSILSTYPNNSYNSISGTSMACPHVSGVAALVVSLKEGNITAPDLRALLESTASDVDSYNPSYVGLLGSGIVNAYGALTGEVPPPPPPSYCGSFGGGGYEYIAGVSTGDMTNISGEAAYTDFTSIVANVATGSTITLTPGFVFGGPYEENWSVWIDFNQDLDFFDEGELVFTGSGNGVVSGTLAIPSSASDTTRMRIGMQYANLLSSPCGDYAYGETEDYTVILNSAEGASFASARRGTTNEAISNAAIGEEDILVYPNPAPGYFHVDIRGAGKAQVQVLSTSGAILKSVSLNKQKAVVDISDLAVGTYMISVKSADGLLDYTERLIKK